MVFKSCKKGSAVAQNNVGDLYLMGSDTFPKDHKKAFYWTKKAAEQGLVGAQINLGSFLLHGNRNIPENIEKGIEWIIKAAETGDESASRLFKLIRGNPINEKDF
ncbi:tetratricopeptide repeat protein [Pseudoalteromonas sp. Hal099]